MGRDPIVKCDWNVIGMHYDQGEITATILQTRLSNLAFSGRSPQISLYTTDERCHMELDTGNCKSYHSGAFISALGSNKLRPALDSASSAAS